MNPYEKVFLLTDGCMWEINKQAGNEHPHAVEVVDMETGAVRYIKSGSRIKFLGGEITDIRAQKDYRAVKEEKRKEIEKTKKVPGNRQDLPERTRSKTIRRNKK